MKLLICICYHHDSEKTLENLFQNLKNIQSTYKCNYKIVIHVNNEIAKQFILKNFSDVEVNVCYNLLHPFLLTWQHRQYMKDCINDYDVFMYIEDDVLIKYEQLINYIKNIESVWPKYVPTFFRYEVKEEEKYAVDVTHLYPHPGNIISLNKKYYVVDKFYCGCWVLPAWLLKEVITEQFTQITNGGINNFEREHAASFVNWHLNKQCLIELDDEGLNISELSLIHHMSNKYVNCLELVTFGKTKVAQIFK